MSNQPMRSPLGRALGLGSAKNGVQHWWLQRVTAVALVAFDGMVRGLAHGACGQ